MRYLISRIVIPACLAGSVLTAAGTISAAQADETAPSHAARSAEQALRPAPPAIPPPRCEPVSQYDVPYEWAYRYTSKWSKGGHGWIRHHFYLSYTPPENADISTAVKCQINF
jgi:hypothetical protein